MDFRPSVAAALLIALAGGKVRAEPEGRSGSSSSVSDSVPAPPPRLSATRVSVPPVLDGRLDDPVWTLSNGTSAFTQQSPYDGNPATETTTLRVVYDDEALYLGFDCPQNRTAVVGRLTRRDEDSESDWVWVNIDSRRDGRTAYVFAVNVKGVVGDALQHDGNMMSFEWDENWEAKAVETPRGWSAEMRIPFRVLRFTPDLPVQDFGLWATRFIGISQERDVWPYISRDVAAPIPLFGRLTDLRQLNKGGSTEVRPFGLAQVRKRAADAALVNHGYDQALSAGVDLKLHISQSMTLDAAVNPDFAQVEADQLILNLNNYEIQYPEKRPLFLEGSDLFATPLGVFYSRRIGSSPLKPSVRSDVAGTEARLVDVPTAATIYGALKISGRFLSAWTVGVLSALASRNEYEVQAFDNLNNPTGPRIPYTVEPLTVYNVLRLRRDLGERAHLGFIATATNRFEDTGGARMCPNGDSVVGGQRCFRDATVAGFDAVWRSPQGEYVVAGQLVGSVVTHGGVDQQLDGTSIGPGDQGIGGWLRVAKEGGRTFLTEATYTGVGRRLTYNDLGYMPRQNLHEGKLGFELRSLDPGSLTLERHGRLDLSARRSLDGLDLGMTAGLGVEVRMKGFWSFHVTGVAAPAHLDDREVGDGSALERARYLAGKFEIYSDPRARWGGAIKGEARFLDGGTWVDAQAPLTLRALPQFTIDLVPQISYSSGEQRFAWHATENVSPAIGQPYIFGRLLARSAGATLRIAYTFTPRLSLQTFGQLFIAAGHYSDFRQAPRGTGRIRLADLVPLTWDIPSAGESDASRIRPQDLAPMRVGPVDADFEQAALNLNVVLRWEYRLGSTLFVVYSRSQAPDVALGTSEAALRLSAIGRVPAVDTFLIKLSFWWAS